MVAQSLQLGVRLQEGWGLALPRSAGCRASRAARQVRLCWWVSCHTAAVHGWWRSAAWSSVLHCKTAGAKAAGQVT